MWAGQHPRNIYIVRLNGKPAKFSSSKEVLDAVANIELVLGSFFAVGVAGYFSTCMFGTPLRSGLDRSQSFICCGRTRMCLLRCWGRLKRRGSSANACIFNEYNRTHTRREVKVHIFGLKLFACVARAAPTDGPRAQPSGKRLLDGRLEMDARVAHKKSREEVIVGVDPQEFS